MSETVETPVSTQPQSQPLLQSQWVDTPSVPLESAVGLEYLASIDQLLVHQKVELIEAFTEFEANNKYTVKNSMGQKVFIAVENTDCCTRNCCGPVRPFEMNIFDNKKTEVLHLSRPLRCDSCCCPCFLQRLEVKNCGNIIGHVIQEWSVFKPKLRIENSVGECLLRISGPFCTFSCCGDVEFEICTKDESKQIGKITKQWSGLARELFTDADHFGITFPIDTDVRTKALLLGACFLIDYMFFEKIGRRETDSPGMT